MVLNFLWLVTPFYKLSTPVAPSSMVLVGFSIGGLYHFDGGALLFFVEYIYNREEKQRMSVPTGLGAVAPTENS